MKVTFSSPHWGNIIDSFKVENEVMNKRPYKIKSIYSFMQKKITCRNTHLMRFCRQKWNLGSKTIDQLIKEIKLSQKEAKYNKVKIFIRCIMSVFMFSLIYIFPSKKWQRHQVWVIMSTFASIDIQDLYSKSFAYAVVCLCLKSRIPSDLYYFL